VRQLNSPKASQAPVSHAAVRHQPQAKDWEEYHSAWQNYYQQYYDAYYQHKTAQAKAAEPAPATQPQQAIFSTQPEPEQPIKEADATTTKDEALLELREKLLGTVRRRAKKIRKSRHFVPIAAALTVVALFGFLQYNQVLIGAVYAYVSPGSIDPQSIVIDPSAGTKVSGDPKLIIPKINVDVPAVYGVGADHDAQMAAMQKGVAHFAIPGANSHPGEIGNTVLSGHSSNDLFDPGEYKFIFAQLDKLENGDTIYANYNGTRYTYVVTKKEVVLPTQVDKLIYPTDKPMLTLITCTPLGTAQKRLLITAEQISPDPGAATAAPAGSGAPTSGDTAIPGNSATLLERLFGAQ
jgi:sortase A